MKSLLLPALLPVLVALLGGCAVLDPYNIVGRNSAPSVLPAQPVPDTFDTQWRVAALDTVWSTVNERYYDPKLNGVDWKAARAKYENAILKAPSDDEYWELLDKMTGELRDSHTRVHGPKDAERQRNFESHSLGLGFLEIGDALVVTTVNPDSDAWWAGVRPGMLITAIDGTPALARFRALMAEVRDSSTPWAKSRGAMRKILVGDVDTRVAMTFQRGDGSEISATLKRRRFRTPPVFNERVLPSGFGYVRFSNFIGGLQDDVLAAIDKMKDTPGMIVDLRNNGGGSLDMASAVTTKFLSEKVKAGRVLTRTGKPISIAFIPVITLEPELKGDKATAYVKPLVILTNENSASASEVLSATLQDLGRATVIGERTCGCLLGYLGYADLPGGGKLAYSELGFVSPKGRRIEGEGVAPDLEIKPSREDIVFNRDRVLEAAESYLRTKTAAATPK